MSLDLFVDLKVEAPFPPLRPFASLAPGPVTVVAPHPDDETIGCGGAMALHVQRGDPVRVVHVTDGSGGDRDSFEHGRIGEVRRREGESAARELGVHDLVSLELPDGKVRPDGATVGALERVLREKPPRFLYAPSPFECHPDHVATCLAAAAAAHRVGGSIRLLLYEVNQQHLPSFLFDITPVAAIKRRALGCYRSQMRYVDIVTKAMGGSLARTVNIDLREVEYAEAFIELEAERVEALSRQVLSVRRWISTRSRPFPV
ncbi:MAG: PIG-L family deacetylase [Planctomycetota bacterium]